MNRTPFNKVPEAKKDDLRCCLALIALVVAGPTVFSSYVFALWDLTASIGLTKAFPWSVGPLSNWLTWFCLALLLHLAAANLRRTSDKILRGGSPHIRTAQVVIDSRPPSRRAELTISERPSAAPISQVTSEVATETEAA